MNSHRGRKRNDRIRTNRVWLIGAPLAVLALSAILYAGAPVSGRAPAPERTQPSGSGVAVSFTDARRQAAEFISYDRSIVLTPEQQKVMDAGLSPIPAPCCAAYSIATCCCPCNLAKSTWGLSKFLIAKQDASATEVRAAASEWLQFTNSAGYTGDACFTGGCNRPFSENGCGGMDDKHIQ